MQDNKFDLTEHTVKSEKVFEGVLLHVFRDEVKLPNGKTVVRELISHNGAVCVVPIDDDGNVYMVRQYRYPFKAELLEIPAGKLDAGELPLQAAQRELEEEIGMVASEMIYMGEFYPLVAYSTEVIHMYVAKGLVTTKQNLDEDEFINIEIIPIKKLEADIMDGNIRDGKTIAAVLKAIKLQH